MQNFGNTPSLLKRPLHGPRRRLSMRRKVLLACVGLLVVFCVLLTSRSGGSNEERVTSPHTRPPVKISGTRQQLTAGPAVTSQPRQTFTLISTGDPVATAAEVKATSLEEVSAKRDGFEVPWLVKTAAPTPELATGGSQADIKALVGTHAPGTSWRNPTTNQIVAFAASGTVAYVARTIVTRQDLAGHQKWDSIYQPNDTYKIPMFAAPTDRDTLQHASIFTSLAAFRDYECATTLRDLYDMAVAPHRLYVGISEERKPSDASCLALIGVEDMTSGETRRVLYGRDAPASLKVELRSLTWADVISPNAILSVDDALDGTDPLPSAPHPDGVFLHPLYAQERLSCVAGELETLRDRLLLHEDDMKRRASGGTVFRQGRGGPQQQPSRALAGCRVTTRVTRPELARGPTFGRYITSLFFFDQDYFMVVDSHTRFSVHWDAKLITRILQLPTPGVLSYYPNGYREGHEREEYGKTDYMLMCTAQVLANGMPKLGARWKPVAPHPKLQGFAAAGFMFGDAQYVLDTPFDPFLPYMFDGEEVLFSARMWTGGWDIYGPAESDVFHHYVREHTPKYFDIIRTAEAARKLTAERRTLYLLRRAQPWVQELVTRGYVTADGQQTLKPLPPVEPPESRLIVSDEVAAATRGINVWKTYYGMGTARTLAEYWEHTELSDKFVKKKDNEGRWMGGEGLCKAAG
ncbi:Glycosyltransferase (GlcNAc) [Lotmaria passim]